MTIEEAYQEYKKCKDSFEYFVKNYIKLVDKPSHNKIDETTDNKLEIYTDGAYKPSTDQGGWSFILTQDNKIIKSEYNGVKNTTNNRMEIMGPLKAIEYLYQIQNNLPIIIYTDSQYVFGTTMKNWKRNKNQDLWEDWDNLMNLIKFPVTLEWVKGHADNELNNLADKLAVKGSELLL